MTVRLEGFHAVKHALRFAPDLVDTITVRDREATHALADQLAADITELLLAKAMTGDVEHQTGVEGTARRPAEDRTVLAVRRTPLVLLDDPRHPGNAGAVVRVAAAAGASGVAMTGALDPWHAAVLRGSAGLHYALPVLSAHADEVTGPILVLDADGDDLRSIPNEAVLVVGSERAGVGSAMRGRADAVVRLPMREGVSSLNLATAVAAVLYAWRLDQT
ncbi:MAG: methyltransferase, TrmH family [Actinomycetota bacterium]|jgi:TrmH family RNA methyltransferase|nr:methyltransferase, TrmH family [Actinomycetota bacterium]